MRQEVPKLDNSLSNDEFLSLIVNSFQSVVFGTVDRLGNPHTNVADIEIKEKNKLFFSTTYQKAFYHRLQNHPRISITALKGKETMDSVGFTLDGIAKEVDLAYLNKIFAARPEMQRIAGENYSERKSILRPFAITPLIGSIYDLRQSPIFQKEFDFTK